MARVPRISEVTGRRVREWRDRRNITAEELAELVADMGDRLSRVAITQIENGKRKISLDEAFTLAAALNVPPPLLFLPLESGERVALTPKIAAHPDELRRWLVGEEALGGTRLSSGEWMRAAETLGLWETLHEAHEALQETEKRLRRAEYVKDQEAIRRAREGFVERLLAYADVRDQMREAGITPPGLPKAWATELSKLGRKGA